MRSSAVLAAVSLVIIGCGSDLETTGSPASADLLQGIWRGASTSDGCVDLYAFYGDHFERVWFCARADGSYAAEKYEGTFAWLGEGEVALAVTRSSCAAAMKTFSVQVAFMDDELRLTSALDSVVLARGSRADTQIANAPVEFGCFEDGEFERSAVRDVH